MGRAIVGDASSERKLPRQAMTMILAEPRKIPFKWTQTANASPLAQEDQRICWDGGTNPSEGFRAYTAYPSSWRLIDCEVLFLSAGNA